MPDPDWIYPEHGVIADWTKEDIDVTPHWNSETVAAYQCMNCQAVVPVTFVDDQTSPPPSATEICWSTWGGCGKTNAMKLVSDGYLYDNESDENTNKSDDS